MKNLELKEGLQNSELAEFSQFVHEVHFDKRLCITRFLAKYTSWANCGSFWSFAGIP